MEVLIFLVVAVAIIFVVFHKSNVIFHKSKPEDSADDDFDDGPDSGGGSIGGPNKR